MKITEKTSNNLVIFAIAITLFMNGGLLGYSLAIVIDDINNLTEKSVMGGIIVSLVFSSIFIWVLHKILKDY